MTLVRSALLVAVTAAVVAVPASSYADSRGHTDPTRDVHSVAFDSEQKPVAGPSTPEPTAAFADVTRVRVTHGARTITVRMTFRDLAHVGTGQVQELLLVSPKRSRLVYVVAGPGHWKGTVTMRTLKDKKVGCRGLSRKIDYARNTIRVGVPRACLGRPSTLKVGTFTMVGVGSKLFYDDGFTNGGEFDAPFGLSPKIHR